MTAKLLPDGKLSKNVKSPIASALVNRKSGTKKKG
jgi:hypothetical protein